MNRSLRLTAVLGSQLVMVAFAATGRGELITFEFTGTVTSVQVMGPEYQSINFPRTDDPFTGFYTFDSDTQVTTDLPERGGFRTVLTTTAIGVTIGDLQFEGLATSISTFPSLYEAGDWIPGIELTSDPSLAQRLNHNNFQLEVRKENLLDDLLPLEPPSLVGAEVAQLRMSLDDSNDLFPFPEVLIVATLDTLRVVPEPQSLFFLLLAAVGCTYFFHRGNGKHVA